MSVAELETVRSILEHKITVSEAEWKLRAKYGSGDTGERFQKIYNYLDELAGVLDGSIESADDIRSFREFLVLGDFSEYLK
jgi:hypothetical protein